MKLDGKSIVVTGGAQGLGLAIAKAVVRAGATVSLLDIDQDRLAKASTELDDNKCRTFVCDIRDLDVIRATVPRILEWQPQIDVLVNNAGVWTDNEIEANDPDRRKLAFDTNAVGHIQMTNELLPILKEQQSGHIFNVISTGGDALTPSGDNRAWQTYGATKWAMTGFTKALRESLVGSGIKVSGFFPGGIDTNFYENAGWPSGAHEQPWMMNADDVADVVLFALTRPHNVLVESLTLTKFTE